MESFTFELFTECMADIAESVAIINEICLQGQLDTPSFRRAARNVSVAIRKVMFDGGGNLFKDCVEPCLHPLKDPRRRPKKGLGSDVLVERIEGMAINYTVGESKEQKTFTGPAYEHRTLVNPLYGLRRVGKEQYQLDDPFDLAAQPMKYSRWMNLKVLQVGDAVLSAERVLRLLANYEGAHINSNEMTRFNASSPIDITLPDRTDELYRKGTWVTFGGCPTAYLYASRRRLSCEHDEGDPKAPSRRNRQATLWYSPFRARYFDHLRGLRLLHWCWKKDSTRAYSSKAPKTRSNWSATMGSLA